MIVKRLVQEGGARQHFPSIDEQTFKGAKESFEKGEISDEEHARYIFPLYKAFINKTDPTAGKSHKFTAWVCKAYLHAAQSGNPIKAEDLYKIANDLKDFERFGKAILADGKSPDINSYGTYEELVEVLAPYQDKRDRKKEQQARTKQLVHDEAVTFYDGPEGRIVMPLTVQASQFWGQRTRWCIAAKGENNMFDDYFDNGPIFIFLPAFDEEAKKQYPSHKSHKFALVHGDLWDETDEKNSVVWRHGEGWGDKADILNVQGSPINALLMAAHREIAEEDFDYIVSQGAHVQGGLKLPERISFCSWVRSMNKPEKDIAFINEQQKQDFATIKELTACLVTMKGNVELLEEDHDELWYGCVPFNMHHGDWEGLKEDAPALLSGMVKPESWQLFEEFICERLEQIQSWDDPEFVKLFLQSKLAGELLFDGRMNDYQFGIQMQLITRELINRVNPIIIKPGPDDNRNPLRIKERTYHTLRELDDDPFDAVLEQMTNDQLDLVLRSDPKKWHSHPAIWEDDRDAKLSQASLYIHGLYDMRLPGVPKPAAVSEYEQPSEP